MELDNLFFRGVRVECSAAVNNCDVRSDIGTPPTFRRGPPPPSLPSYFP